MLTGVRLAIGTAWLVIVAAEMLTGGVGIGFWVWEVKDMDEAVAWVKRCPNPMP